MRHDATQHDLNETTSWVVNMWLKKYGRHRFSWDLSLHERDGRRGEGCLFMTEIWLACTGKIKDIFCGL